MPIRFASKPGLVAYLTVGDPDLATTHNIAIAAIDAGADVLELGVPFSDPLADGPVIQRASERAVKNGTRLRDVLALAAALRIAASRTPASSSSPTTIPSSASDSRISALPRSKPASTASSSPT